MSCRALACAAALTAFPSLAGPDTLAALEEQQTALFERVAPAVVVIRSGDATSAGFAVAPGLVVTSAHGVLGATDVEVTLRDGRTLRGVVVERSGDGLDVALVRVPATTRVLSLTTALEVRTGSLVAVVGHGDLSLFSLATGLVSNASAAGPGGPLLALQIPLRPGASGGPVVDRSGRVIGVVAHGAPGAVAFAIRSEAVLRSLPGLAAVTREPPAAAPLDEREGDAELATAPPLAAPLLVVGPAEPRRTALRPADRPRARASKAPAAVPPRIQARTPERARVPGKGTTIPLAAPRAPSDLGS
jgi:S1-C subfamily serine protease